MRIIYSLLILSSLLFSGDRALSIKYSASEKRTALIIGNNDYKAFSPLKNPINDARLIKSILEKKNFNILYKENATKRELKQLVRKFQNEISSGGVGLFYFSGHGLEVKGQNYLIAIDSEIKQKSDSEFESLALKRVIDSMSEAKNRLNIILLDACRNDPFSRSGGGGLAAVSSAKGMIIAYATAEGKTASDGSYGEHGPFTKHLTRFMMQDGLELNTVFTKTRQAVYAETNGEQIPAVYSQLLGEFYFSKPKQSQSNANLATTEAVSVEIESTYEDDIEYIEPEMVFVEKDEFMMGSKKRANEQPIRSIKLQEAFYVSKFEVSAREYKKYASDLGIDMPEYNSLNDPITNVSWYDAKNYATWLSQKSENNYRLITEIEWEYLAHKDSQISSKDMLKDYSWYKNNSKNKVHIVGTKKPNSMGIYDLFGNVKEWCIDDYANYKNNKKAANINDSKKKVVRGGSFTQKFKNIYPTKREWAYVDEKSKEIGFRLVRVDEDE